MSVDPAYRHHPKRAVPDDALTIGTSALKWYQLAPEGGPIAVELIAQARAFAAEEARGERLRLDDDRGFVIFHRCGARFYFLLISIWRGSNELWEAVYYRDAGMEGFAKFDPAYPTTQTPRPTFCVWELGIVAYEAQAWVRYLSSPRGDDGLVAWRDDRFIGDV